MRKRGAPGSASDSAPLIPVAPIAPVAPTSATDSPRDTAIPNPPATPPIRGSAEPCQPGLYNYRFAANEVFDQMLERLAEVCSMGNAHRNMSAVLFLALDEALDRHDPVRRQARREKRLARKAESEMRSQAEEPAQTETSPQEVTIDTTAPANTAANRVKRTRHIPAALRDQLLIRAGHRCEYRSDGGPRCSARSYLEVDHITPFGLRGATEEANLQVLCAAHNQLRADHCYGAGFIDQKISSAREERRADSASDSPPRPDEVTNPDEVCEPAPIYVGGSASSRETSVV